MADAADPAASAHWWAETLGWQVTFETRHEVAVEPPAGRPGLPLVFVPVPDHTSVPNRVRLALASPPKGATSAALVDRLVDRGATPADPGQGQGPLGRPGRPRGQRVPRAVAPLTEAGRSVVLEWWSLLKKLSPLVMEAPCSVRSGGSSSATR